jgi:hypothetical protein
MKKSSRPLYTLAGPVIAAALAGGLACVQPVAVAGVSIGPAGAPPAKDVTRREAALAARPAPAARVGEGAEVVAVPVTGSELVRARATVEIAAPIEAVRAVVLDLERYPELTPIYSRARVFGTTARGGRDVYLELNEMGGGHLWVRAEISRPKVADGVETYDARLITGNVDAFRARWQLEGLGRERTRLTLESFVEPALGLPARVVNRGNMDGARETVLALKRRAELAPSVER